jgi:hypothetical protein
MFLLTIFLTRKCFQKFFAYSFLKVHLHHSLKIKRHKEVGNIRNQGFSYYSCLMMEGSGSGSVPLTSVADPGC